MLVQYLHINTLLAKKQKPKCNRRFEENFHTDKPIIKQREKKKKEIQLI